MRRASDAETASRDRCFTLFPNLPAEIRLMIWEAALPEEICEIWDLKRGEDIIATTPRATANIAFLAFTSPVAINAWKFSTIKEPCIESVAIPLEDRNVDRIVFIPPNFEALSDRIINPTDKVLADTIG
ncbi:hypothetical protein CEK25_003107 [Fusarium fujikuroi]|nr:hypothetical protein CEK25_003107 [Fusarium fujikuroi]